MDRKKQQPELFYDYFDSPLGPLWIVADREGLSYLLRSPLESTFLEALQQRRGVQAKKNPSHLSQWHSFLTRYFSGEKVVMNGPIHFLEGTPFQKKVWRALLTIPYGRTRSYQWLGEQLSLKRAGRAVGNACGKNPIPVILPCHRIVCQDGTLGGYTGGVEIKKKLLTLEGVL